MRQKENISGQVITRVVQVGGGRETSLRSSTSAMALQCTKAFLDRSNKQVISKGTECETVTQSSMCLQHPQSKKQLTLVFSRTCFYELLFCRVGLQHFFFLFFSKLIINNKLWKQCHCSLFHGTCIILQQGRQKVVFA